MHAWGVLEDEQGWAEGRREFVADSRDGVADSRDATADEREVAADSREAELEEWERRLEARAVELGLLVQPDVGQSERGAARVRAEELRSSLQAVRLGVEAERDEASKRRLTDGPPTLLALAFADIAEQLYNAATFEEVLQRIAEAAVSTVVGCSSASVTVKEANGYRTAATTGAAASAADQAQYRAAEGPSLDAFTTALVSAPSFPDERWPLLAAQPADAGVLSAVAYHLPASTQNGTATGAGSLNTYGATPDSFDDAAQQIGFILAAHASLAARAVGERGNLEDLGHQLQEALFARDVIGQAKGILMERMRVSPEDAFDILRRSSQHLNVKLREVARKLTETGQV